MSCHQHVALVDTTVDQGPELLYNVLRCPSTPVLMLVYLTFAGGVGLVGWRLYQSEWTIEPAEHREMLTIAASIAAIATATLAVMRLSDWPYLVDVGAGVVLGYVPVVVVSVWGGQWVARRTGYTREQLRAAGWFGVAVLAYIGSPVVSGPDGTGIPLTGGRLFLVGIAVLMIVYSWIQYADRERARDDGEIQGVDD